MSTNELNNTNNFFGEIKEKTRDTFELIKFSHTIFALPFALIAYIIATQGQVYNPKLIWILLCLVFARTAAMAFNRWIDAPIDAENPRTKNRHIPSGKLSSTYVASLIIISSLAFVFCASQLNLLCLVLSPLCLGVLFFYSITKRFTHYTQLFLGISLGIAPLAVTIAIKGTLSIDAIILSLAVLCWVAGFDTLYALQDLTFDAQRGLHSLPVKLGMKRSFLFAKILHLLFLLLLLLFGYWLQLSYLYWTGFVICVALTAWQHFMLKDDLKNLNMAFFTANGLISLLLMIFTWADVLINVSIYSLR